VVKGQWPKRLPLRDLASMPRSLSPQCLGVSGMIPVLPSRHGRPCPGHPGPVRRCAFSMGITALDTLSRHGRPCAGHPDPVKRYASTNRDHRDEPGDDGKSGARCNVLTLFLTLCFIWARPLLIPARRGRAREASQEWGGERSCSRPRTPVGGRPLAALGWSKSKRLKVPRARRRPALPFHHTHRPGCPSRHPRSISWLRAPKPWA
jgi:hypothetical protein